MIHSRHFVRCRIPQLESVPTGFHRCIIEKGVRSRLFCIKSHLDGFRFIAIAVNQREGNRHPFFCFIKSVKHKGIAAITCPFQDFLPPAVRITAYHCKHVPVARVTNLVQTAKELQDQVESINVEFNNKLQEYQKNYNTLSESVRQLKEKELSELQQRREEYSQVAQQDYQKRQNELLAPIIEKARAAIDKVAKANGFTAVFDISTGAIAYFDEATLTDLAPQVKTELGIKDEPAAEAAAN